MKDASILEIFKGSFLSSLFLIGYFEVTLSSFESFFRPCSSFDLGDGIYGISSTFFIEGLSSKVLGDRTSWTGLISPSSGIDEGFLLGSTLSWSGLIELSFFFSSIIPSSLRVSVLISPEFLETFSFELLRWSLSFWAPSFLSRWSLINSFAPSLIYMTLPDSIGAEMSSCGLLLSRRLFLFSSFLVSFD